MRLKVKSFNLRAGKPIAFMHDDDAKQLSLSLGDRIEIEYGGKKDIAVVDLVKGFLKRGEIAVSHNVHQDLNLHSGLLVDVVASKKPQSAAIIQNKVRCSRYTKEDLKTIISDIVNGALTETEIAYFISGIYHCGMSLDETQFLTEAIVETGKVIQWRSKGIVADKHSVGGIPGNRTTPIIVAICAAAGVIMPKTSSRAITSAAGTADVVEAIAPVDFSVKKLKHIVAKTGACLAWGGSLGLAPADDMLIQVEKVLNLVPEPQLLASILAKKIAVGSTHVLIDIPCGPGAKVSKNHAKHLKKMFIILGKRLGLTIIVAITKGNQPIGNGVGPNLEIKDVLKVLRREEPPKDLERKAVRLAGIILEMTNTVSKGNGKKTAQELLDSGKAYKKFSQIIYEQGGSIGYVSIGKYKHDIRSTRSGTVSNLENREINYTARLAGCPSDKAAGLYLQKHVGENVKKGEVIVTIYSQSQRKLREAVNYFNKFNPIRVK